MDEETDELKEIKSFLRSVLITEIGGLTVSKLLWDYKNLVGSTIPFEKYGFTNFKSFLETLPDTVRLYRDEYGEERVTHVSDQKTRHIEQMILKQKVNPKKRRGAGRGVRARGGGRNLFRFQQIELDYNPTRKRRPLLPLPVPCIGSNRSSVVNGIREDNNSFDWEEDSYSNDQQATHSHRGKSSVFSKTSCSNFQFSRTETLPPRFTRLNAGNQRKIVKSMEISGDEASTCSDYVQKNGSGCDTEQPGFEPSFKCSSTTARRGTYRGRLRGRTTASGSRQPPGSEMSRAEVSLHRVTSPSETASHRPLRSSDDLEEGIAQRATDLADECDISKTVQNKVKQVLLSAPAGLWAKRLSVKYKEMFGNVLPVRQQGFHSVIEFVSAMPHIVHIVRPYENGDWLLSDATARRGEPEAALKEQTAKSQQNRSQGSNPATVSAMEDDEDLKESVRQVLQSHTDGVALHEFAEVYQEMTGRKLDPEAYGGDMSSLLTVLTQAGVLRMEYQGQGSYSTSRLYAVPTSGERRFDHLTMSFRPHSFEKVQLPAVQKDSEWDRGIPEDVVGPGVSFQLESVKDLTLKEYHEMHVAQVEHPGLLWVQKRKNLKALDRVMDQLEEDYSLCGDHYRMPERLMTYGQVCATVWPGDGNWHRAVILGDQEEMRKVSFVDYGNVCCVTSRSIRFLKKKFMQLPAQGIQAKLAYLAPPVGQEVFGEDSKQGLLDLVEMRPLMAMVTSIDKHVLSLILVDTNGTSDVFINDRLVKEGFAHFVSQHHSQEGKSDPDLNTGSKETHITVPPCLKGQRFVRQVDFTAEIGFLTIHLSGTLYVASAEVSALFWEEDILTSMLQQSHLAVPVCKMVVHRRDCPALFEELHSYGVYYIDESTELLYLYSLNAVPLLLDMFGNQTSAVDEFKDFIMKHIQQFDPQDPYWKEVEEDEGSTGVSDVTDMAEDRGLGEEDLSVEELKLALHSMQVHRKRILKRMTSESECLSDDIQELENTENSISHIQKHIQSLQDHLNVSRKTVSAVGPVMTPASAHKPPATKASGVEVKTSIKTNIVPPMVQTTPASAAVPNPQQRTGGPADTTTAQGPGLHDIVTANLKMETLLHQQDLLIQSMLKQGPDFASLASSTQLNPGSLPLLRLPSLGQAQVAQFTGKGQARSGVTQGVSHSQGRESVGQGFPYHAPVMCLPGVGAGLEQVGTVPLPQSSVGVRAPSYSHFPPVTAGVSQVARPGDSLHSQPKAASLHPQQYYEELLQQQLLGLAPSSSGTQAPPAASAATATPFIFTSASTHPATMTTTWHAPVPPLLKGETLGYPTGAAIGVHPGVNASGDAQVIPQHLVRPGLPTAVQPASLREPSLHAAVFTGPTSSARFGFSGQGSGSSAGGQLLPDLLPLFESLKVDGFASQSSSADQA